MKAWVQLGSFFWLVVVTTTGLNYAADAIAPASPWGGVILIPSAVITGLALAWWGKP